MSSSGSIRSSGQLLLSAAEKKYIIDGIEGDFRADGRKCDDYRDFTVDTNVVLNTNGSARVRLNGTDVMVGVKMATAEPDAETPTHGKISFMVDCSAGASPAFIARGGDQLSQSLSMAMRRLCTSTDALDLEKLCIIPGERVWVAHVDTLVLECSGGNLFDCTSLAIWAALASTTIQKTQVVQDDDGNDIDFDILDGEHFSLDMSAFPVIVSLTQVGRVHVVDATAQEEACMGGRVFVTVNGLGHACAIHKDGSGSIAPTQLLDILRIAQQRGKCMLTDLRAALGL
eukprot:m.1638901 g.1638901  ORF g.1638901 m.1638901 type:complete len:286 (+) comp31988_c0_seq1:227-1084(+)